MKTLMVAPNISRRMGGEAVIPYHYIRELTALGLEVHALTHARVRDELLNDPQMDRDRIVFIEDAASERLLHRAGARLPGPVRDVTFGQLLSLETMRRLGAAVEATADARGVDIIHQPTPVSPRTPSSIRSHRAPVVIGPMNGGMNYPPAFESSYAKGSTPLLALGRSATGIANCAIDGKLRASRILVANERTRTSLPTAIDTTRVVVLPENGVDLSVWRAADRPPPEAAHFVFVGRLIPLKAVDLLFEAFAAAPKDALLTLIGDGPDAPRLKALAAAAPFSDRITFAGFRPQAEIAETLYGATALVLPSLRECGGAVILEAFACGRPAIATAWGGPLDYVTPETGVLVAPESRSAFVAGLALAMNRLAADRDLVARMGAAARARIETHYSWRAKAERMIGIYQEVLAGR